MNCIWIAQLQGNGEGNSFIDIAGITLYAENIIFIAIMLFMVAACFTIIFDQEKPIELKRR